MPVKRDRAAARAPAGAGPTAGNASPARPSRALAWALALVGILILAAATVVIITVRQHRQAALAELRPSGIPRSIPTSIANLMALSPVPAKPAPGFTLTDQHGQRLALSEFRGKAVVLEFMDSRCTTICPLVSEMRSAQRATRNFLFGVAQMGVRHAALARPRSGPPSGCWGCPS